MICLECSGDFKNLRRGICHTCYKRPGVRDKYPTGGRGRIVNEPSAEEVEAMVARQMEKLPAWWDQEVEAVRAAESAPWNKEFRDGYGI